MREVHLVYQLYSLVYLFSNYRDTLQRDFGSLIKLGDILKL